MSQTSQKKGAGGLIVIVCIAVLFIFLITSSCGSSHAPGYGKTDVCTICGKKATHSSQNYGYCDKHWKEMMDEVLGH